MSASRAAILGARELAFGIAGNEQERAQSHVAFRKIGANGGAPATLKQTKPPWPSKKAMISGPSPASRLA